MLDAAADLVTVIKPQSAFFERFGADGMAVLTRLLGRINAQGSLSLLDCKRGDIGSTLQAYAEAMLGANSPFGADAITLTAYLGFDALRPALDMAVKLNKGVFIVVRSSNPEGLSLQNARLADGRAVADMLADEITGFNAVHGAGLGAIGAVMGATLQGAELETLQRMPQSLFLAPGVGAQGASIDDLAENFGAAAARAIPSVSRAILNQGPSVQKLRDAIRWYRNQAMIYAQESI